MCACELENVPTSADEIFFVDVLRFFISTVHGPSDSHKSLKVELYKFGMIPLQIKQVECTVVSQNYFFIAS